MIVLIVEKCAMTWMVFVIFSKSLFSICEGSPQKVFVENLGILSISSHFNTTFTSRKGVKEFYFPLLEKVKALKFDSICFKKRVKSGAGYNLTSIFVPNCISKNCQISNKHQPQDIGQISISKS